MKMLHIFKIVSFNTIKRKFVELERENVVNKVFNLILQKKKG